MVDWTQFNAADWGIVSILGLSIVLSLWRGFVREAISLAGWVAAFVVANMYVGNLASVLTPWIDNVTGRYVASYAILLAGTLVVGGITGLFAAQMVKASGLTVMDRLLGTGFGLVRGIIIALVLMYLLRQLAPPQNLVWLEQAQLTPYMDMLAQWVRQLFSEYYAGQSSIKAI
ncbi:MAG: CvpA family protein [Halieaceae bacterium]|nr:CvpA family protein [Halieaceae bacterium]